MDNLEDKYRRELRELILQFGNTKHLHTQNETFADLSYPVHFAREYSELFYIEFLCSWLLHRGISVPKHIHNGKVEQPRTLDDFGEPTL